MTVPQNPHRARLAARLRALRGAVGLSGSQLGQRLGWPQPRVSKLETGRQLPTEDDLNAWADATHADNEQRREVEELLSAARIEYATYRGVQRRPGGLAGRHAERGRWEAATTHIAEYQPAMLPGLVQTSSYARELLTAPLSSMMGISDADADALVAERMKRQDLLYQPGRRIEVIVGEAALWNAPGSVDTLINQLDRLAMFAGLPSVEFGVVPHDAPMPVPALTGFTICDEEFVLMETLSGEQGLYEPDEVALYTKAFELLRDAAPTGAAAVWLIRRVAERLAEG